MLDVSRNPRHTGARTLRWALRSVVLIAMMGFVLSSCDIAGNEDESHDDVFPMYLDGNGNGVNDYVEASSHDPGTSDKGQVDAPDGMPMGPAPAGHDFVDGDADTAAVITAEEGCKTSYLNYNLH